MQLAGRELELHARAGLSGERDLAPLGQIAWAERRDQARAGRDRHRLFQRCSPDVDAVDLDRRGHVGADLQRGHPPRLLVADLAGVA